MQACRIRTLRNGSTPPSILPARPGPRPRCIPSATRDGAYCARPAAPTSISRFSRNSRSPSASNCNGARSSSTSSTTRSSTCRIQTSAPRSREPYQGPLGRLAIFSSVSAWCSDEEDRMNQSRRDLLKLPMAAGAAAHASHPSGAAAGKPRKVIEEFDPANIKISHRVSLRVSDDELLFLKQIGLRFFRAEIPLDASLDEIARQRDRFARFGISMYHCAHYAHQSPDILLGIPGRIFRNYEGYRRAEQLAGKSKHWGVRLCVGTWSEGGDQMGKDVLGMIRDFGGRGKIFDIDF